MSKLKVQEIRDLALKIVLDSPHGIRYSDLTEKIIATCPETPRNTIHGSIWNLNARFPDKIRKPKRGLFVSAALRPIQPNLPSIPEDPTITEDLDPKRTGINYWLDLFTGTTWKEFRTAGATLSGFSNRMRKNVDKMQQGDILLCYLTGVMRWVGALKVQGKSDDNRSIWMDRDFPARVAVQPLVMLSPENGVPMTELEGKVTFFKTPTDRGKFKGFVRMSPNLFQTQNDGDLILQLLKDAERTPVTRPVDAKKLARKPFFKAERRKGKETISTIVTVPESEETETAETGTTPIAPEERASSTRHTEMQYHLMTLAAEMGIQCWVARNDRSRKWNSIALGDLPGVIQELPTQFNEATNRTIELIDVLWLKGNSIVAAFEVECTTSIYSGLLRMSDLLALQPNLDIDLYLVAPNERREKVKQEILRPTFSLREKPLATVCGFLAFETLTQKVSGIRRLALASSLRPDFLHKTAEFFNTTNNT